MPRSYSRIAGSLPNTGSLHWLQHDLRGRVPSSLPSRAEDAFLFVYSKKQSLRFWHVSIGSSLHRTGFMTSRRFQEGSSCKFPRSQRKRHPGAFHILFSHSRQFEGKFVQVKRIFFQPRQAPQNPLRHESEMGWLGLSQNHSVSWIFFDSVIKPISPQFLGTPLWKCDYSFVCICARLPLYSPTHSNANTKHSLKPAWGDLWWGLVVQLSAYTGGEGLPPSHIFLFPWFK